MEYPQYSRPAEWMGKKVPEVLLSGHHANIEKWRREQSILRTLQWRPELLEDAVLSKKEWMGKKVPEVLLSGHHANIEKWRREQSILRTLQWRPELLEDAVLSKKEQQYLEQLRREMEKGDM